MFLVRVGEEAGGARGVGFDNAALNCKGAAVQGLLEIKDTHRP